MNPISNDLEYTKQRNTFTYVGIKSELFMSNETSH